MKPFKEKDIEIWNCDSKDLYAKWETPTVIISDGPYGVKGFPGDPPTPEKLDEWYEPHIIEWSKKATPRTSLWFWNTELGWATVHPILKKHGWKFVNCHVWDKGIAHIAGNANSKTLRKLPVVTEIVVQYAKEPEFFVENEKLNMKQWLRHEWERTKLPFSKTNEAAGVKDAATRKYFTKCHLWYMPPADVFEKIVNYANKHGSEEGKPYFSIDGKRPINKSEWEEMRFIFECPYGVTNVWNYPPLNGEERVKINSKSVHLNQKPLKFTELILNISSKKGDVVWDPFGGLATTAIAAKKLKRKCHTAEINKTIFEKAVERYKKNHYYHHNTFIRNIPHKRMPKLNSPTNISGNHAVTMNEEWIVIIEKQ